MTRAEISERSCQLYSSRVMCRQYFDEYDRNGYKKRILLIDVNCKYSSTGKLVYDLYKAIKADGRCAAVCYGRGPVVKENDVYKFGIDGETLLHAGLSRITGYNGCFSPISTRRLINFIDNFKPDLIHIHELHAYFVNLKPLLEHIKRKKISVVWTFHCEYMYTGKCGFAYNCSKFQDNCGKCPAVKEYPKSMFADKTRQMFELKKGLLTNMEFGIVTPSKMLADRVKLSFLKNKPIRVISNGVDDRIFKPRDYQVLKKRLNISQNEKVALFVAPNLQNKYKGAQWVLELAYKLQSWTFIMIGDGKVSAEIPNNIKLVGKISDANILATYYSMADVFLMLSEKETYSMTCAEALCCGTRVVGFKAGAPETIFEEPYAKFFDYGDLTGIIEEMNEI